MSKLRIAVQKSGRLQDPSLDFLKSLGIEVEYDGSSLLAPAKNADIEVMFVRNSDIPQYVRFGVADYAIVGQNVLIEKKYNVEVLKKLGFGKCSLVIAVPEASPFKKIEDLEEERIATSYLVTLKSYLKEKGISASVIEINGSVEICPELNMADAVCDISQTGQTMKDHNLRIIEKIIDSEAVLIKSHLLTEEKKAIFKKFFSNT